MTETKKSSQDWGRRKEKGSLNLKVQAAILWNLWNWWKTSHRHLLAHAERYRTCATNSWAAVKSPFQMANPELWPQTLFVPLTATASVDFPLLRKAGAGRGWGWQWVGWRLERDREADGILFVPPIWGLSFLQINARVGYWKETTETIKEGSGEDNRATCHWADLSFGTQ